MILSELIEKLSKYNPEAEVSVVANNRKFEFSLTFGGGDGGTAKNCESVSFYVDKLCQMEQSKL